MDKPVLSDPAIFPSNEVLAKHLRNTVPLFEMVFQFNHANFPEFIERWKYYNDGKSWLLNVSRKKKTLFWLSVKDGFFRTTFYLNAKGGRLVPSSRIPKALKSRFEETEGKRFRGITVEMKKSKDVEVYKEMLALKMASM